MPVLGYGRALASRAAVTQPNSAVGTRRAIGLRSESVCGRPHGRDCTRLVRPATVLFVGILLSIPDQSFRILGAELVALAFISAVAMLALDRRASAGPDSRDDTAHALASILEVVAPNAVTSILLLIAGLLLVFGLGAGLDVLMSWSCRYFWLSLEALSAPGCC